MDFIFKDASEYVYRPEFDRFDPICVRRQVARKTLDNGIELTVTNQGKSFDCATETFQLVVNQCTKLGLTEDITIEGDWKHIMKVVNFYDELIEIE